MSKEFNKLQKLHKDNIVFISCKKKMDPFQMWLWWFSGLFSNEQKYNLVFISLYILYYVLTNLVFWIIISIVMAILIDKLFLLFIVVPLLIPFAFRSAGHGLLTYDILKNEKMFDILWSYQLIGGIVSTKKTNDPLLIKIGKEYLPEKAIWSNNKKDWRIELSNKF